VLLAESYPDEVWLFCNTIALAAVRIHNTNEGAPDRHAALFARWVASARETVVDRETGLLVAKAGYDGSVREGPEGSTLWLAAVMLRHIGRAATRFSHALDRSNRRSTVGYAVFKEHDRPQITTTVRSGARYRRPIALTQLPPLPSTVERRFERSSAWLNRVAARLTPEKGSVPASADHQRAASRSSPEPPLATRHLTIFNH